MNSETPSGSDANDEFVDAVLDDVRAKISADDKHLEEARARRNLVLDAAMTSGGMSRRFNSGSVAHGTVNRPVTDADCGVVLDRRTHSTLGPDSSEQQGPEDVMTRMRDHVMAEVRKKYPDARGELHTHAILINFNKTVRGVDPTVDLIVGLERKDAQGIWIPDRDSAGWEASDPKDHTQQLTADPKDLRVHRARLTRLAKAAIKCDGTPIMFSFNIEALALTLIKKTGSLAASLEHFFSEAAASIEKGLSPDPAGVSDPIQLPEGVTQTSAAKRLREFAGHVAAARKARSKAEAEAELAKVFPKHLGASSSNGNGSAASDLARELEGGGKGKIISSVFGVGAAGIPKRRSYGEA